MVIEKLKISSRNPCVYGVSYCGMGKPRYGVGIGTGSVILPVKTLRRRSDGSEFRVECISLYGRFAEPCRALGPLFVIVIEDRYL